MQKIKNQKLIKITNLTTILKLIRKKEIISRAELAKIAKLSPTTISDLTQLLLNEGVVIEIGEGTSKGGRKPILLSLNDRCGFFIGVDIAVNFLKIGIFDIELNVIQMTEKEFIKTEYTNDELSREIIDLIQELLEKSRINKKKIFGIGISVEGIIDYNKKVILSSTVYPHLRNVNLFDLIKKEFDVPVYIENGSQLAALAEKQLIKRYSSYHSVVFFEVNTGIGEGIILDDKIYNGAFGGAGEIGHITVDVNGPVCNCGNRGCLEVMANKKAIINQVQKILKFNGNTVLKQIEKQDITLKDIGDAAAEGDQVAIDIIRREAKYLAAGVLNIINTFNPEAIIIGGDIIDLGDNLIGEIKKIISNTAFAHYLNRIELVYSKLQHDVKLKGAGLLAVNMFFENPFIIFDFD
ncbi:MAG: ROK family transcriptional regulator [Clostridia bacterium]|nr:ROK family transcriptional regulator [Clostridia bacterium]